MAGNGAVSMETARPDPFLTEYSSEDAVRRYTKGTAGNGVDYLLKHEYGAIYRAALRQYVSAPIRDGVRLLEFGCGGGMNLIHLVSALEGDEGILVRDAYGTDFSERLIESADKEKLTYLTPEQQKKVRFLLARNECLVSDMSAGLRSSKPELLESFHLIIGVNTFRYCHRLGKSRECAKDIFDLLTPGGICVMIDMNQRFPAFRSLVRDRLTKPENERYIPSLEQYAAPFAEVGFDLLQKKNFCWIPHSAGPALLSVCRAATPVLDRLFSHRAMRSLVVAKKPA